MKWYLGLVGLFLSIPANFALAFEHQFAAKNILTILGEKVGVFEEKHSLEIEVLDADTKKPMPYTVVLVGEERGKPFDENFKFADASGKIKFEHASLQNPLPVTIAHIAYITYTIAEVKEGTLRVLLKQLSEPAPEESYSRVEGEISYWPKMRSGDDVLDLGLVIPTFSYEDIVDLNIRQLFGPKDNFRIHNKEKKIPSNFYLPEQTEYVKIFFPVTLNKPTYWLPMLKGENSLLVSAHGGGSFSHLMELLEEQGAVSEIINAVNIDSIGWEDLTPTQPTTSFNIPLRYNLKAKEVVLARNFPADKNLFFIAAVDYFNDKKEIVAHDFKATEKYLEVAETELKTGKELPTDGADKLYFAAYAIDLPEYIGEERIRDTAMSAVIKSGALKKSGNFTFDHFLPLFSLSQKAGKREFTLNFKGALSQTPGTALGRFFAYKNGKRYLVWKMDLNPEKQDIIVPLLPEEFDPTRQEVRFAVSVIEDNMEKDGSLYHSYNHLEVERLPR